MKNTLASWLLAAVLVAGYVVLGTLIPDRDHWPYFVVLALLLGIGMLGAWKWGRWSLAQVLVAAVLMRIAVFWLPPTLSDDAYRYVWDGVVQAEGINPYRYAPEDTALAFLHDEPMYEQLNSGSYYSVYPPVSQMLFWVGSLAYERGGWLHSYYLIKLLLVLLEMGAVVVLARMVEPPMLVLYAWNPLVVLSSAGQAHSESAFVFLLLLTVLLARRGRGVGASVALAAAGWVKLYPFVLLPFLWRRFGSKSVIASTAAVVLLGLPYAAWYVPGHLLSSLELYTRYFEFNAGLYYGLKQVMYGLTGDDWSKQLGPFLRNVFLLLLPVLYVLDWRKNWRIEKALLVTMGAFFVLSTTVHPWYLVGIVALAVLFDRPAWHWLWVGVASLGTYLHYSEATLRGYWLFVWVGWGGGLILLLRRHGHTLLQWVQKARARQKVGFLAPSLPFSYTPLQVLDLGAGEGYVGAVLHERFGAAVTLADVVDFNQTDLPLRLYDGARLPFADEAFDVVVLYFVLHHCEDQEAVIREALRVARHQVLVVESVFETARDRWLLERLDRWVNRLRSGGKMTPQEVHLRFRKVADWKVLFAELGAEVDALKRRGRWIHKQALFALTPPRQNPLLQKKKNRPSGSQGNDETT